MQQMLPFDLRLVRNHSFTETQSFMHPIHPGDHEGKARKVVLESKMGCHGYSSPGPRPVPLPFLM
jgi:hypothetical protein